VKTPEKSVFGKPVDYSRPTQGQGRFFAVATLMAVAALGLLSLADSNRAAGADPQKDALKTGAQLWVENCTMCHEVKPRTTFSRAESDAAKLHMRDKADLSPEEQEAILGFLKSGS
jgi:mono/diheme cytochrome c family protein